MLLVGDSGGTKTHLALKDPNEPVRTPPLVEKTYKSAKYASLEAIVKDFLTSAGGDNPDYTVLAVAGPVVGGRSRITNLPWELDEVVMKETLGLPSVKLLNDLEATAHFIPFLQPDELHTINEGTSMVGRNLAVVAVGTGLGEAFLTLEGEGYKAHATEGGHTNFSPSTPLQISMLRSFQKRFGSQVSVERVCSGIGIRNIYEFLRRSRFAHEPKWLKTKLKDLDDPVPIIMETALEHPMQSELCDATLSNFLAILGNEVGNFALKTMSLGGIYLGGGIPPKILQALESATFLEALRKKGRMTDLVSQIPVHVVLNSHTALLGTTRYAYDMLGEEKSSPT